MRRSSIISIIYFILFFICKFYYYMIIKTIYIYIYIYMELTGRNEGMLYVWYKCLAVQDINAVMRCVHLSIWRECFPAHVTVLLNLTPPFSLLSSIREYQELGNATPEIYIATTTRARMDKFLPFLLMLLVWINTILC
jgi:hypothetical protein